MGVYEDTEKSRLHIYIYIDDYMGGLRIPYIHTYTYRHKHKQDGTEHKCIHAYTHTHKQDGSDDYMGGLRIPFTKKMLKSAYLSDSDSDNKHDKNTEEQSLGPASGGKATQRAHFDIHAHSQGETGGLLQWFAVKGEDELGRAAQGKMQLGFQFRQLAGDLRSIKRYFDWLLSACVFCGIRLCVYVCVCVCVCKCVCVNTHG